jgi:hypothetical protein
MADGVGIDLSLGPVDLMAGIKVELGKMNKHNDWERKRAAEAARAKVPAQVRMFASVVIPTPTVRTGINIGGPDAGYFWLLRRLVIGGTTFKTTAAGTAEVYVTGLTGQQGAAIVGPIVSAMSLNDMVDQFATLPTTPPRLYSNQQVIVQAQENLMVVIDTGTAGQQYTTAAQFEVWRTVSGNIDYDLA